MKYILLTLEDVDYMRFQTLQKAVKAVSQTPDHTLSILAMAVKETYEIQHVPGEIVGFSWWCKDGYERSLDEVEKGYIANRIEEGYIEGQFFVPDAYENEHEAWWRKL